MPERDALDWDSNRSSNSLSSKRLQTIMRNPLPLKSRRMNGHKDTLRVNYLDYRIIFREKDGNESILYHNSWVTDIIITHKNVELLSRAGRCRWKVENECFNTLKNQGYHIEHNYGHGSNHLCLNFYLLTLLAFYVHQVFELTDGL